MRRVRTASRLAADLHIASNIAAAPVQTLTPMRPFWRTLRDFILWSYERGSIQYDVMVTLILLFIFLSPYWLNFKDKPVQSNPHRTEVVVVADEDGSLVYRIDNKAFQEAAMDTDAKIRSQLLRIIQPVSGNVTINRYERIQSHQGTIYKVWAQRQ